MQMRNQRSFQSAQNRKQVDRGSSNSPLWYKIELMAVKKNSETISTLPFNVMTVSLATILRVLIEFSRDSELVLKDCVQSATIAGDLVFCCELRGSPKTVKIHIDSYVINPLLEF
jgi:hypothetical protein